MNDSARTTELVERITEGMDIRPGTSFEGTRGIDEIAEQMAEDAHPDFVTVMVGQGGVAREYPGVEGFREALKDWISPYESFRLEIDEVLTPPEKLVFLVRQIGTTKHGGVEIENASGSVYSLVDGQIKQAAFYIDQQAALEAAGLDPKSR